MNGPWIEHDCRGPFTVLEHRDADNPRKVEFELRLGLAGGTLYRMTAWAEPAGCSQETPPAELREAMLKRADELGQLWRAPLGTRCYGDLAEEVAR